MLDRLEKIIRQAGFTVKVLDADKVPTRHRSAWIAENAPGVDVIISHPQPVRTGLTLFDAAGQPQLPLAGVLRDRLRPVHLASGIPPVMADRPEASLPRLLPLLPGNDAGPGDGA